MLWAGLIIGIGVIGAFLLLLAAPVQCYVELDSNARPWIRGRVRAFFGLVRIDIPMTRSARKRDSRTQPRAARKKSSGSSRGRLLALLRREELRAHIARFTVKLVNTIRFNDFIVHAQFGFEDPADTGELWGVVSPLAVIGATSPVAVTVEPCFDRETFKVQGHGTFSVAPLTLIGVTLQYLLSPATLRDLLAVARQP